MSAVADELVTAWYDGRVGQTVRPTAPRAPQAPAAAFGQGVLLAGRYRLGEVLGAGAFASVHAAWDLSLQRWVAVKLYPSATVAHVSADEIRLQATCQHPNLMPLFDAGSDPLVGAEFLVMPLYPGADLASTLARYGPLPFRRALLCVDQVCSALEFLWQQRQAIHADVKPANIWLTHSGAALLIDFNLHGLLVRGG